MAGGHATCCLTMYRTLLPSHALRLLTLATILAAGVRHVRADPIISEFMAATSTTLADEDREYPDWIEIHNPDATPVNLAGWYLTDSATNRTKWQFPAVTIAPGGYLVVFASNKNRRDPARQLHTNFALAAEGEYLGLIRPDGATVAFEYAPVFPPQNNSASYGVIPGAEGAWIRSYFSTPTPGAANATTGVVTLSQTVNFSRAAGLFTSPFQLELTGAGTGQHIRYETAPPSEVGAIVREPSAASPRYTGPLAVGGSLLIRAAVFTDNGQFRGVSSVAHYFRLESAGARGLAGFTSRLPVFVFDQHGYGGLNREDGTRFAWLYGFPARPNGEPTFAATTSFALPVSMAVRGASSAIFPKKSYNLDLSAGAGRRTHHGLGTGNPYDEWALVGVWQFDPSHIRNSVMYTLSNRIGRWAPRVHPVEVFLNTDGLPLDQSAYVGVYVLTDRVKIEQGRVAIAELSSSANVAPQVTGGYLLKIDVPEANEYTWKTDHGLDIDTQSSVLVASPKLDRLTAAQRDYIRGYVQRMENALHADRASGWRTRTHLDYLDRDSWVDHHLLNTFSSNPDALERSAFFHKDRGGRIVAGPIWDFDRALGSFIDDRSVRWDVWNGENAVQPWHFGWWGVIATDPEFMQAWVDRWQELRRDHFSSVRLTGLVDELAAGIGNAAAQRDAERWEDNVSHFGGTYAGEIAHLKDWVTRRAGWIDQQFAAAPTVVAGPSGITIDPIAGSQVAYTLDGSDPRSRGGDVAPNALLASGRVTVPLSANLQVRTYRADMKDRFPGSPWSSAVGGPSSTRLTPRSRLINLASRGLVGTGENALISGMVVADTASKGYLIRGVGPGLVPFGATGTVSNPQIAVYSERGVELFRNQGWLTGGNAGALRQAARTVGAFPLDEAGRDAALAVAMPGNAYTVQMTAPTGTTGIGLAEVYELDDFGGTSNLSTRAHVGTGERVLIGGFILQGGAHQRMLIRGVGPTLAALGVSNALRDPVLTLRSGVTEIASNRRWANNATVAEAGRRVGAFSLAASSADAALFLTLAPGAYTVEVRSDSGAEGVALLEIYEVP